MKKRMMALALAGVFGMSMMAGCGSSSSSGTEATATSTAADSGDSYNISFIVKLTDGHFSKVMAGAQAYADEHDNVNVEILSPTSATAYDEQINMIETALGNDSTDAVVISPLQSDSAANLVANTDKVIVACDTNFESDKVCSFVGTGNKDAAKSGAEEACKELADAGNDAPTAVILTGVQGDETHDARLEGYTEGVEEAGGEVLEVQYCDAQADKAATATEAILQKYQDGVDMILCTNDDMAMAAAKAIKDGGNSAYDDTILCGFDGNTSAIQAIQEGSLTMDVAQLGYDMGYKSMEAAVNKLEGKDVESFVDSGAQVVTADNCEDYIADMKDKGLWEE